MTVKNWTEFRYIVDGIVLLTFDSEKAAHEWAKRVRSTSMNRDKITIKEVSISELPKRKFLV